MKTEKQVLAGLKVHGKMSERDCTECEYNAPGSECVGKLCEDAVATITELRQECREKDFALQTLEHDHNILANARNGRVKIYAEENCVVINTEYWAQFLAGKERRERRRRRDY